MIRVLVLDRAAVIERGYSLRTSLGLLSRSTSLHGVQCLTIRRFILISLYSLYSLLLLMSWLLLLLLLLLVTPAAFNGVSKLVQVSVEGVLPELQVEEAVFQHLHFVPQQLKLKAQGARD